MLHAHDPAGSRHGVRNRLAEQAAGEWLCFLDADDHLADGYLTAMQTAADGGDGFRLLTPAVAPADDPASAGLLPVKDIRKANYLVIGTLIQRERFLKLGGFADWNARTGNEFEDWDLWIRAIRDGATVVQVPDAVYLIDSTVRSVRAAADSVTSGRWLQEIGHYHFPALHPKPRPR